MDLKVTEDTEGTVLSGFPFICSANISQGPPSARPCDGLEDWRAGDPGGIPWGPCWKEMLGTRGKGIQLAGQRGT